MYTYFANKKRRWIDNIYEFKITTMKTNKTISTKDPHNTKSTEFEPILRESEVRSNTTLDN